MYKLSKYNIPMKLNKVDVTYNSVSKAFCIGNVETLNSKGTDLFEYKELIDNGFLVETSRDELKEIEYLYNKTYYSSSSLNVILTPTLSCNFRCPYCFEKVDNDVNEKGNYYEVFNKYADRYFQYYNNIQISLFGGEPLLQEKNIFSTLEYIFGRNKVYNSNITTSIVTNGSLLNEKNIKKLVEFNCKSFQITIDGNKYQHDSLRIFNDGTPSYDLLISNIKLLLKIISEHKDIKFILRINLQNRDIEDVKGTLMEFSDFEKSQTSILFRPIYKTKCFNSINENNVNNLKKFYDLANEMGFNIVKNDYVYKHCEATGDDNAFYLMPDLTIWKCINDLSYDVPKIGHIDDSGEFIIYPKKLIEWRRLSNCFDNEDCIKCKMLPDCFGGCMLYRSKNKHNLCSSFEMASIPNLY